VLQCCTVSRGMLRCAVVCCSVLHCVAVCCSCCSVLQSLFEVPLLQHTCSSFFAPESFACTCTNIMSLGTVCCSVMPCVAKRVRRSASWCKTCCTPCVFQSAFQWRYRYRYAHASYSYMLLCVARCMMQGVAGCCSVLQCVAV